jgi:hypothetical protein
MYIYVNADFDRRNEQIPGGVLAYNHMFLIVFEAMNVCRYVCVYVWTADRRLSHLRVFQHRIGRIRRETGFSPFPLFQSPPGKRRVFAHLALRRWPMRGRDRPDLFVGGPQHKLRLAAGGPRERALRQSLRDPDGVGGKGHPPTSQIAPAGGPWYKSSDTGWRQASWERASSKTGCKNPFSYT